MTTFIKSSIVAFTTLLVGYVVVSSIIWIGYHSILIGSIIVFVVTIALITLASN
ncbi:MAG: hypothetical protein F6K31_17460 [Symploca sp. SIO2G7]|nr:hypothetical protein [Symploca sp. SIO2G7]